MTTVIVLTVLGVIATAFVARAVFDPDSRLAVTLIGFAVAMGFFAAALAVAESHDKAACEAKRGTWVAAERTGLTQTLPTCEVPR